MLRRLRLPIAKPCHENWDAMDGEGARRHCEQCQTNVTNLSDLTEPAAAKFLRENAGNRVCVRYRSNPTGEIRFKARSTPAYAPTAMRGLRATLVAAGLAAMSMAGCTGDRSAETVDEEGCTYEVGPLEFRLKRGEGNCPAEPSEIMMGDIAVPEPPPEVMGKIAIEEPVMGEAMPMHEPEPKPEPEPELMGDVAAPEDLPEPMMGQAPVPDDAAPCGAVAEPSDALVAD